MNNNVLLEIRIKKEEELKKDRVIIFKIFSLLVLGSLFSFCFIGMGVVFYLTNFYKRPLGTYLFLVFVTTFEVFCALLLLIFFVMVKSVKRENLLVIHVNKGKLMMDYLWWKWEQAVMEQAKANNKHFKLDLGDQSGRVLKIINNT